MKLLYKIKAFGLQPTPWSPPRHSRHHRKDGSAYAATYRGGKSTLHTGKSNIADWQAFVAEAAKKHVNGTEPESGTIKVRYDFFAETPAGRRHGEIWDVAIKPVVKPKKTKIKGKYYTTEETVWIKKIRPGYTADADLTNLQKGTEDALEGIVFHNDVICRGTESWAWFGPQAGVLISVFLVEEEDFPGRGDPV